ncbi:hypothetical protein, partial [Anaerotruncus rubiinfantis]|uniref:hypothetical protein n=1 Tax=Anaerotruncus rubiinfantis TaxID=1720200 RepID=UPI0034A1DC4B
AVSLPAAKTARNLLRQYVLCRVIKSTRDKSPQPCGDALRAIRTNGFQFKKRRTSVRRSYFSSISQLSTAYSRKIPISSLRLCPVLAQISSSFETVSSLIRMEKVLYPSSPFGRLGFTTIAISITTSEHILCLNRGD